MANFDSHTPETSEPSNFKEKKADAGRSNTPLGAISEIRNVLMWTLAFVATWVVFKGSGYLDKKSELDSFQPIKAIKPEPAQNESKTKARKALNNLKIPVLKNEEQNVQEVELPDDVGFGGPDPEEEEEENDVDTEKHIAATFFLSFPYDKLEEAMQETGFDELHELKDYMRAVASLRDALKYGEKADAEREARELLRVSASLETRESEFHKEYIRLRRKILRQPNGREKVDLIKKMLIFVHKNAKILASY